MNRLGAYLFTGPEPLLNRRAADQLLAQLEAELGELDVTEVRGSDLGEDSLPDLRTASLFATPRAYVVRDAQLLPKVAAKALKTEIDAGTAETTIILMATQTKPIMGLAKSIKTIGGRVDITVPKEWEERAWKELVNDEFRRHNREATNDAVVAVLSAAGNNVNIIAEKVTQAVAVGSPDRRVTVEDVESVVVGHGSKGAFAVADAMVARAPEEALRLLHGCLEAGDHPIKILGGLIYKMRQIIAVAAGLDGKDIGLSISRGQRPRLEAARRNFGPGELTTAMQHLAACDVELHSGDLNGELAIERAVLGVASRDRLPVPSPDREIIR